MSSVAQLIGRVSSAGYAIVVKDGKPTLKKQRGEKKLPDTLLEELKQRRDEVLAWFDSANPQKAPRKDCESSTPEPNDPFLDSPLPTMEITPSAVGWTTCGVCLAEVQPEQMQSLPVGMWMQMCGTTHPNCPYRKSSR